MALTELEKVAVFFVAIGPERAEGLLARLGPDAMMRIAAAMKRLRPIPDETRRAVLREMLELLTGKGAAPPPGRAGEKSRWAPSGPPPDDLERRVADLFRPDVDVRNLNWEAAGLDLNAPPPRPPDEDEGEEPPTKRF
jgi:hypothetical protein